MIILVIGFLPFHVKGQFNTASGYETTRRSSQTSLIAIQPIDTSQKGEKENREIPRMHAPLKSLHITSGAGWRMHPITGKITLHHGIDLQVDFEPVYTVMMGL